MYSVEDLLVSHGYKLPRSSTTSSAAPYDNRNNDCRRDTSENRSGGGALNGLGTEAGADGRTGAGVYRPAPVKAYPENNNNEGPERIQRRIEAPIGYLGDLQPLGDSLATDSGFYDAPSLTFSEHTEERDVAYWRRRGQDFSALLDYADPRELRVSGGLWRGQGLAAEELRAERSMQRWEEGPWMREPVDSGPETLRVTGERKCQSLGTEEWRPAVGLGRQLSDGEAERWSQEQQHRLRLTESSVPPTVRGKSQSLPRVLSPEDIRYGDPAQVGHPVQSVAQRINGSAPYGHSHSEWTGGERWSGQSQGHGPAALVPKPRFSRPVKPPSYETHQQNRGSWETLSSEPVSKPRDRSLCYSQSFEPLRDRTACYSQSAEPLRERSVCFSQSAEPVRDRLVSHSQSAEPLRDRLVSHSQSAEPLRDRMVSHSQSADVLRDRMVSHSQSADLLRDRLVSHSQSADLLRDRLVCHSQSADLLRDRFASHSQSADLLRDRFASHSQSAEPLRDRSLCYSQSSELLRDRSVCYSQSAELLRPEVQRPDLFYHDPTGTGLEPPGYIPPPSYRRAPLPRAGQNYRADSVHVRWKREPVSAEMGRWFSRQAGMSWSEQREERNMIVPRRPVHPGPVVPNRPGVVQYVPFDDPRIRHISGGPSGNSLTDADKIRHVSKELPCTTVLGQSTHDSAFLPTQGPSLNTDTHKTALSEYDNANRWHRALNKGNDSVAPDQSCAKYHMTFQIRPSQQLKTDRNPDQQSRLDRISDQVKVERMTDQIKVDRNNDQAKVDRITDQVKVDRITDQVKADKVTDQVKADRVMDQVKTDSRFTDKQIKAEKAIEPSKSDRITDKQIKQERITEKQFKTEKVPEKNVKPDKNTDKPIKVDKMPDKQMKADKIIDQIKVSRAPDKHSKDDKPTDKGSSESVSQVKTEPVVETEKPKSVKKKLSETIFCLVSVPVSLQASGKSRDQNNNEEKEPDSPPIPPPPPPSSSSENSNTLGSLPNQSLKSTSTTSTDLELQALTGSVSSSRAPRRVHRRKDSHSRIIKPNPHDELRRYSGAWPGDQYRDQETQTSPEPIKSTPHSGPPNTEAQETPAAPDSETPQESGVNVDSSTPYGYPMKGQKSLKPSSNSAFSRTGTFSKSTGPSSQHSHRPPLHPPPHPPPPPPNQPPSQPPPPPPTQPPPKSPPSEQTEEAKSAPGLTSEAFGQFLLKPVGRRPWDAIEELESINKELQDQAGKRPSVDQCIEDLNEAYKDILELSTASNNLPNLPNRSSMQIPDRIKARLPAEPLTMPGSGLRSSLVPTNDPEYREVKSAFSRPSTGKSVSFSKQLREEICPAPPPMETGFRDYKAVMSQISQRSSGHGRTVKLDVPAPQEIPIRDNDLTAQVPLTLSTAAEVPWADRQPMQDASTLTSPPDYEHICQSLQLARDSGAVSRGATIKHRPGSSISETPQHVPMTAGPSKDSEQACCSSKSENERQTRQELIPLFREERSSGFRKVTSQSNRFLSNRGVLCSLVSGKPIGDRETKVPLDVPDVPADWQSQLSLAEKHLETLLTGEQVNQGSAENLNIVSIEKSADVVPDSESTEKQGDGELGINMLAEKGDLQDEEQGADQKPTRNQLLTDRVPDIDNADQPDNLEKDKSEEQVSKTEGTEVQEHRDQRGIEPKAEPSLRSKKAALWTHSGMDPALLPEFPPDHLPLSVLAHPNRRLSLGVDWERRGWEGDRWTHGGGWARERRSLDAERRGIGGERWGLDDYRQDHGTEKRGLGGWRGFDIDRQGKDDEDWDLDIDRRDISDQGQALGMKWRELKGDCSRSKGESSISHDSLDDHKQDSADEGRGTCVDNEEPNLITDRLDHGLSLHTEAQGEGLSIPPEHGVVEKSGHLKEADSFSHVRCLSLHSTDSQEGEDGTGAASESVEAAEDDKNYVTASQDSPNSTEEERESSTPSILTSEPGIIQDDQPTLTESNDPSRL